MTGNLFGIQVQKRFQALTEMRDNLAGLRQTPEQKFYYDLAIRALCAYSETLADRLPDDDDGWIALNALLDAAYNALVKLREMQEDTAATA